MSGELTDAAQMRRADALAIAAGTSGVTLMRRAGEAVAAAAVAMARPGGRILILCGPGNNGGDGFVAARLLAARGFAVRLELLGAVDDLKGDAAFAAAEWSGPVEPAGGGDPAAFDLVIDALFGTGLTRNLSGDAAGIVERVNASGARVLAVDIPSGVDSDTGQERGAAIRAERTATFVRHKPGHLLYPGRAKTGDLAVADIGVSDAIVASLGCTTWLNEQGLWGGAFPRLRPDGHKYDRGHVLVVSGGASRTGAARMAARGAFRIGAGLVTLVCDEAAMPIIAAQVTAIMIKVVADAAGFSALLDDKRYSALVLGPGLGVGGDTRALVEAALAADRATILDADALTSFAGEAAKLAALIGGERTRPVILTPHEGEFARLFRDAPVPAHGGSKLERARAAAAFTGAIVILKGADTVIATPDGRAAINANATPWLGTAGAGDVLCGFVAGLAGQGTPGFEAACAAVWLHAEAGRRFGPGLIAEDLPEALPTLLRKILGICQSRARG